MDAANQVINSDPPIVCVAQAQWIRSTKYEILSPSGKPGGPVITGIRLQNPPCFSLRYLYNVHMNELRFVWDQKKDETNVKKHGVSFEEARTAFYDEDAIQFFDPDHSDEEDRFILLGLSLKPQILVVCHCFREKDTVIRIFSARKADKDEELEYWKQQK